MPKKTKGIGEEEFDVPQIPDGDNDVGHVRFGYLVHDVSRMRRTLIDHWMRPLGITRAQWWLLSAVARRKNEGMTQVELARLLEVGKVTVGGLVDRLEASGHIERRLDHQDRRVKRINITPKGWDTIKDMIQVAENMNARVLAGVSAKDLKIVEDALAKIKNNVREALKER